MSSDKHQYTWGDWQAVDREDFRGWWRGAYDHKGKLKDQEWRSDDTTPRQTDDYAQISQQFGQVSLQDDTYYTQQEDYTTQNTEVADPGNADFRSGTQSSSKSQKTQSSSAKSSEKHKPSKSSRDAQAKPAKPASSSKGAPPAKHSSSSGSSFGSSSGSSSRAQPDRKSAKPRFRSDDDDEEGYGHRQTMPPLVEGQEYTGGYDDYRAGGPGGLGGYEGSHNAYAPASADAEYGSYRSPDAAAYGDAQGDYAPADMTGQGDWRETGYPGSRLPPPSRQHGSRAYPQSTHATGDEIGEDDDELFQQDYYHQDRPRDTSPGAYAPAEPRDESKHAPKGDRRIMGTQGYYEELDPRYVIEHSSKFQVGEVFKVLWSEPYGSGRKHTRDTMKSLTERDVRENYGEKFWVGFRRFIVVATDEGHSTCVPILTYERKACTKKGVKAAKHGIVYTEGKKPQALNKEPDLGFAPVRMRMNPDVRDEKLAPESRINYSKLVTVEHNVKVFFIGHIIGEDIVLVSDAVDSCWSHKKRSRPKGR